MKNIQVTDEIHDFLMNLSKEINSQNHRGTRMPYFFQVQETKEIPTGDGMGEEVWVMDGEIHLRTQEDIKRAVFEWREWELGNEEDELAYRRLMDHEITETLEYNYTCFNVTTESIYSNSFLTSKACDKHIEDNRHNLTSPVNFLSYASRNPELEGVLKFLCELTGGELHK